MAKIEKIPSYVKAILWISSIFMLMPLFLILSFMVSGGGTDTTGHTLNEAELQAKTLMPFGKLTRATDTPAETTVAVLDAQATYDKVCAACHSTGVSGSPIQGDQVAWQARLDARGSAEALAEQAIAGINAMPPKGGASFLSDEDFKKMVAFMLIKANLDTGNLPIPEAQ